MAKSAKKLLGMGAMGALLGFGDDDNDNDNKGEPPVVQADTRLPNTPKLRRDKGDHRLRKRRAPTLLNPAE